MLFLHKFMPKLLKEINKLARYIIHHTSLKKNKYNTSYLS